MPPQTLRAPDKRTERASRRSSAAAARRHPSSNKKKQRNLYGAARRHPPAEQQQQQEQEQEPSSPSLPPPPHTPPARKLMTLLRELFDKDTQEGRSCCRALVIIAIFFCSVHISHYFKLPAAGGTDEQRWIFSIKLLQFFCMYCAGMSIVRWCVMQRPVRY
jgi:hypothetical protein